MSGGSTAQQTTKTVATSMNSIKVDRQKRITETDSGS